MISFLIAVRNEEQHIGETLECLRHQTFGGHIEVLIFDAESTDQTVAAAQAYESHFEYFKIYDNPKLTASSAWNLGVQIAKFPIVSLLSGHVMLPCNYCGDVLNNLTTEYAGVGFRAEGIGSGNIARTIAAACNSFVVTGGSSYTSAKSKKEVDTVAYGAYWKEALQSVDGFDEQLLRGQDWDINLRLTQNGRKLALLTGAPVQYFVRGSLLAVFQRYWMAGLWKPRIQFKNRSLPKLRHLAPVATLILAATLLSSLAFFDAGWITTVILVMSLVYFGAIVANYVQCRPRPHLAIFVTAVIGIHFFYGLGVLIGFAFFKRISA